MKILMDTHIILWALTADDRLSTTAKELIVNEANELYFSMASIWEVEIKSSLGKMPISGKQLFEKCIEAGYELLNIKVDHIANLSSLKRVEDGQKHNDPFDRLLIAQAKAEGIKFITHDSLIPGYNEPCILTV